VKQQTIAVGRDIRAERQAAANRFRTAMTERGTLVVRLISSPGSGKTTLLEKTAEALRQTCRVGILVGDVETDRDAQRLAPHAPSCQITTGGACHLELSLVEKTLPQLGDDPLDILFIEDVGNLICPASYDLGEHLRVLALSVTEGDDKPGKYPKAFRTSHVVLITKTDLLPYLPFSLDRVREDAWQVQPDLTVVALSALREEMTEPGGMREWLQLLQERRKAVLEQDPVTHSPKSVKPLNVPNSADSSGTSASTHPTDSSGSPDSFSSPDSTSTAARSN
jgi:hydrogenase nickel incorporation protein HypB